MKRWHIFCVQVAWLIGLGILAALYFEGPVKSQLGWSLHITLGSVPVGAVWFGALGAVLISLTGIVEHAGDWDPSFDLWHLSRPLIGAALAVVAVLILQAGVLAAGKEPSNSGLLYYLVAFLVGYREETFRDLIKRLVDVILAPAATPTKPAITSLSPVNGPIAGGGPPVKILGSGFVGTSAVTFGSATATFKVDSDGQISADLPASPAAGPVTVTVKTKGGSATGSFTYVA